MSLALLLAVALPAISFPDAPLAARYEIVESLGATDGYAAMAIDPQTDHPVVALIDTATLDQTAVRPAELYLRRYDGWTWQRERIGSVPMVGTIGDNARDLRIAINASGRVHVLLIEPHGAGTADDALVHIEAIPGAPVRHVLDVGNVATPTLTMNAASEPIAAWIDTARSDGVGVLRVQQRALGTWSAVAPFGVTSTASRPAFAVQPIGTLAHPELVYAELDSSSHQVRWARIAGSQVADQPIATFVPGNGDRLQWQYFATRADGSSEIAIVIARPPPSIGAPPPHIVQRRVRVAGSTQFVCAGSCAPILTALTAQGLAPNALAVGPGQQWALTFNDLNQRYRLFRERSGATFSELAIHSLAKVHDVAYDSEGQLHALALDFSNHRDLVWVRELPPWVIRQGPSGLSADSVLALTEDSSGAPVFYAQHVPNGSGSVWTVVDGGFSERPLPPALDVDDVRLDVDSLDRPHLALKSANGQVHYAFWTGSDWSIQALGGPLADDFDLALGPDGRAFVLLRHGAHSRIWTQGLAANAPRWLVAADGLTRVRLAATGFPGSLFVAGHDPAGDGTSGIRVLRIDADWPSGVLTETLLAPLNDAGLSIYGAQVVALDVAQLDRPAIAYSVSFSGTHRLDYAIWVNGSWTRIAGEIISPSAERQMRDAQLRHVQRGGAQPRLLFTYDQTGERRIRLAQADGGDIWQAEPLGAASTGQRLAMTQYGNTRLAFIDLQGTMSIATHYGTPSFGAPLAPTNMRSGQFILWLCVCQLVNRCNPGSGFDTQRGSGQLPLLARLHGRFQATPAGRYYLDLYHRHAAEILGTTLGFAEHFEARQRTFADLFPALNAFAEGDGSDYVLSPQMLASARTVWEGWAQRGSPELAAAIQFELERSNNLQSYANLNFEQWFQSLQTGPSAMLADGFE